MQADARMEDTEEKRRQKQEKGRGIRADICGRHSPSGKDRPGPSKLSVTAYNQTDRHHTHTETHSRSREQAAAAATGAVLSPSGTGTGPASAHSHVAGPMSHVAMPLLATEHVRSSHLAGVGCWPVTRQRRSAWDGCSLGGPADVGPPTEGPQLSAGV